MRIAVIGCGSIARTHIDVVKHLKGTLVALCDRTAAKAEKLKAEYSLDCAVYTDYVKMLDEVKPDAVHVCTPHYEHCEMSVAALKRGVNVLCEKPVCIDEGQYRQLIEAEALSSAQLGVCFQNRYLETNEKLKSLANTQSARGIFAAVAWSRDENYYKSTDWRGIKVREGGGVMMNQAIHTLDLAIWMLGEPIAVIGSVSNNHLKGIIDEEDTAEIYIEFAGGAKAVFYATTANADNTPVILSLSTEKGSYTALGNKLYDAAGNAIAINEKTDIIAKDYWGNGHLHLIRDFYDCIKTGRKLSVGVKEAFKAVKVALELYRSNGEARKLDFNAL